MNNIQGSIIQKVKDELGTSDDVPSTELYDLLYNYRSSQHPDKYSNDDAKKAAEEKFKRVNNLLSELSKYVEMERLQKKPNEVIPYQKTYDLIVSKQDSLKQQETIEKLKETIKVNEIVISDFKKEIAKLRHETVDKKTQELIKLYKPSKKNLISLGITFALTSIFGVLTKIEEIANFIFKYAPFDKETIDTTIFILIISVPIVYLKMIIEEKYIQSLARRIKTPLYAKLFNEHLELYGKKDAFSEMDVFGFLTSEFVPTIPLWKFLWTKVFNFYGVTTIDGLKDIFIFNLFNKQLITVSSADNLDRKFSITKSIQYWQPDNFEF